MDFILIGTVCVGFIFFFLHTKTDVKTRAVGVVLLLAGGVFLELYAASVTGIGIPEWIVLFLR